MDKFNIDFFELCFLAETCIPPVPIARAYFWDKLINIYYNQMDSNERVKLYNWITSNSRFIDNIDNEDCQFFVARFNPNNQYRITVQYDNETEVINCFKLLNEYRLTKTTIIPNEYIINIEKIEYEN